MTNEFLQWLAKYGLTAAFTTSAGDTLYTNREKKFGVLAKNGEYGVQSFYLDDIIAFKTFDDENLIAEWNCWTSWRVLGRSTRFSTNEVYMDITLKNQQVLRLQIFRGVSRNVDRDSNEHINLFNYACQISQYIYNCANGLS